MSDNDRSHSSNRSLIYLSIFLSAFGFILICITRDIWPLIVLIPSAIYLHKNKANTKEEKNARNNVTIASCSFILLLPVFLILIFSFYLFFTKTFPNILFEVNGYDVGTHRVELQIWTGAKNTFTFFTIMSVLIASMGLFGLVVFAAQRRVKEIGVRKVQGARAEQILPLVTKQFIVLVLAANVIVFPLGKMLEKITPGIYKYQFTIWDILLVLGVSVIITLISSGYQAFRASQLNPVEALRYE